jgi:hypothetical protein
MDDLELFLKHNVEGYLFKDLAAMRNIPSIGTESGGGLGYPLLFTCFAGIELLGALTDPNKFDTNSGGTYFANYWQSYLYPATHLGKAEVEIVYRLARNGVAHNFLLKGELGVVKGDPALHLKHDSFGKFIIDASQLSEDLEASYTQRVHPLLAGPLRLSMDARRQEIGTTYSSLASGLLARHPKAGTLGPTAQQGPTGVQGFVSTNSHVSSSQGLSVHNLPEP